MTSIEVHNPHNIISSVDIVEETDKVVVVIVDLMGDGKHAEIEQIKGNTLYFGDMESGLTINHPFGNLFYFTYQTSRYTCTITVLGEKVTQFDHIRRMYERHS